MIKNISNYLRIWQKLEPILLSDVKLSLSRGSLLIDFVAHTETLITCTLHSKPYHSHCYYPQFGRKITKLLKMQKPGVAFSLALHFCHPTLFDFKHLPQFLYVPWIALYILNNLLQNPGTYTNVYKAICIRPLCALKNGCISECYTSSVNVRLLYMTL